MFVELLSSSFAVFACVVASTGFGTEEAVASSEVSVVRLGFPVRRRIGLDVGESA